MLHAGGKNLCLLWPDVLNIGPSLAWSSNISFSVFPFFFCLSKVVNISISYRQLSLTDSPFCFVFNTSDIPSKAVSEVAISAQLPSVIIL